MTDPSNESAATLPCDAPGDDENERPTLPSVNPAMLALETEVILARHAERKTILPPKKKHKHR